MPKRGTSDNEQDDELTPRKSRRISSGNEELNDVSSPAETPSGRKSILKTTPRKINGLKAVEATPSSLRKVLFATPKGAADGDPGDEEDSPAAARNDRSARRKSRRTLQRQIVQTEDSEGDDDAEDEAVAQAILREEEEEEEDDEEDDEEEVEVDPTSAPDTPSKTGRPRGRPKGRRRERTPSPPPNLPPHELYFFQNRTGANKTSANIMPSHLLLNHEDYFAQLKGFKDPHSGDMEWLEDLHKRAFDQWIFELEEGFNICLYGYGSKRKIVMDFAEHLHFQLEKRPRIIVVNGYSPGLTVRDILTTLGKEILPKNAKLPAQPLALLEILLATLSEKVTKTRIHLIIHSLDHSNLQKDTTQSILSRLAAHPAISLISSCDTPGFPLLWDSSLSTSFCFLFHDTTTFQPFTAEVEVVEEVNALLGRSSRRLGGKDGVGYVLKSLPENARSLFRIMVAEQLALADSEGDIGANALAEENSDPEDILGLEDEDEAAAQQATPSRRGRGRPPKTPKKAIKAQKLVQRAMGGVEYRMLYHKAVEEFVCSSEVNFRTLLKEFHDHQMIESRKDALGTERLVVPFRRDELETILEELV